MPEAGRWAWVHASVKGCRNSEQSVAVAEKCADAFRSA
jgi:hypothetical protein